MIVDNVIHISRVYFQQEIRKLYILHLLKKKNDE